MGDNNSWFKIYRKMIRNPLWQHDINASHLFVTLLMLVDRKNGSWSGGRNQLEAFSGIKNSTIFKCLKRLEKAEMVTLSSNSKFTTIHICNWNKYQDDGNKSGNSSVTASEQQRNTLTRKRKRIENINTMSTCVDEKVFFYELVSLLGFDKSRVKYLDSRKNKLKIRLKMFEPDTIKAAAKAIGESPYHQGDNESGTRYGDIDFLLRNDAQIEKWSNMAVKQSYGKRDF